MAWLLFWENGLSFQSSSVWLPISFANIETSAAELFLFLGFLHSLAAFCCTSSLNIFSVLPTPHISAAKCALCR